MSEPGPLEAHASEFASRNQFVFALLGLLSARQRLEALVERHAPLGGSARLDPRQPFLLMVLGAISLGKTLQEHVSSWAAEAPNSPRSRQEPEPWLRGMLR